MGCVNCKKCGDLIDIDKRIPEHDEGLDCYFCDVECQLSYYQSEYDRLVTEKNKWKRDCLTTTMVLDELKKDLVNAKAEIITLNDSVKQAMKAIGL